MDILERERGPGGPGLVDVFEDVPEVPYRKTRRQNCTAESAAVGIGGAEGPGRD